MSAALCTLGSRMASGLACAHRLQIGRALRRGQRIDPHHHFPAGESFSTRGADLRRAPRPWLPARPHPPGPAPPRRTAGRAPSPAFSRWSRARTGRIGGAGSAANLFDAFDQDEFALAGLVAEFRAPRCIRANGSRSCASSSDGNSITTLRARASPSSTSVLPPRARNLALIALKGRLGGLDIGFVGLGVVNIHARDPISLWHQAALNKLRLMRDSAICTAFSAAPLRRLSDTIHRLRPCSTVGSLRMRLT